MLRSYWVSPALNKSESRVMFLCLATCDINVREVGWRVWADEFLLLGM